MKTFRPFLAFTFLIFSFLNAQPPMLNWATNIGSSISDEGMAITTDKLGNIYTAGRFYGTVDFEPGPGITSLHCSGNYDIFIQKLDPSGTLIWVKQMAGTGFADAKSITVDENENVYTTGFFTFSIDFDPGVGTTLLTSLGGQDGFTQKLDASGNLLWVRQNAGADHTQSLSITLDDLGYLYTTGAFKETVDFDSGIGVNELTSYGGNDIFIQKLDLEGDLIWVKQMGSVNNDNGMSITTDDNGNIYTTGNFSGLIDFDPGPSNVSINSIGGSDAFIHKMNSNGDLIWVRHIKGNSYENAISSVIDPMGNIYTTGYLMGVVDFDPGVGTYNLTSNGITDIFVQKMDSDGIFLWAKNVGGTESETGNYIATDSIGNVYTTGNFEGTVDFDPNLGVFDLNSNGGEDVFIQKLNTDGDFIWAQQLGGTDNDRGNSIAVDLNGDILTTGYFMEFADFDPNNETNYLISNGNMDAFIQKLGYCNPNQTIDIQSACGDFTWNNGQTYSESNFTAKDTLTNIGGCDSIVTLNLTIYNVDVTTTQTNGINLSSNETGATYQWIDCENENYPITGATSQVFTATENGNYAVIVSINGCSDTSICLVVNNVGLKDFNEILAVKVFPNPTHEIVNIYMENTLEDQYTLEVFDATGRILKKQLISDNLTELSLLHCLKGVYTIRISNKSNQSIHRLVRN